MTYAKLLISVRPNHAIDFFMLLRLVACLLNRCFLHCNATSDKCEKKLGGHDSMRIMLFYGLCVLRALIEDYEFFCLFLSIKVFQPVHE